MEYKLGEKLDKINELKKNKKEDKKGFFPINY